MSLAILIPHIPCWKCQSLMFTLSWRGNHTCNCARGGMMFFHASRPISSEGLLGTACRLTFKIKLEIWKKGRFLANHILTSLVLSLVHRLFTASKRSPSIFSPLKPLCPLHLLCHWLQTPIFIIRSSFSDKSMKCGFEAIFSHPKI